MIWLTWRQHRRQALFTLAGLAALAALLVPTGLAMRNRFADLGGPECVRQLARSELTPGVVESCNRAFDQFSNQYGAFNLVGVLFLVLPLLVGLFWGAPLVAREVEQGTHRLVWTQGVSRRRWAAVKFGLVGAGAAVAAAGYGLGMSWWLAPLTQAERQGRFDVFFFDMQGLVPVGYTVLAVALGIFAGTLWPRMLPAMGATLAGFLALRVALVEFARPHYMAARTRTFPVESDSPMPHQAHGDWVLANGVRDADGTMVAANAQIACPPGATGPTGGRCGAELGLEPGAYNWQLYQPADRYWAFQYIETGIFVALAALLLLLAVRRIRRIA
ncbi:transporter [Micromonospora sp. C28SCA-DRY-2]|uniref:transporter n=1 Tax=Micromonospora sp. C28SCA-DRY-2 TaxID=3059522 RepID=UPI002675DCF7|nr:transporter [Micromonospora sp. C28SCA-DRY-2]MDO3703016.1 transporter [Micromonospora sp. C28SCA-DRY-2]